MKRKDMQIQTDRTKTQELDFEAMLKEFERERLERKRRSRNKSKKRGRR